MSMQIVEYYIRQVISDGIQDLRNNIGRLDEVFEQLLYPPLDKVFGKKLIDEIKCFFINNNVPVRSAFSQNAQEYPMISVHLVSSQEDPEYRSFQDHMEYQSLPKEPAKIEGPFYGMGYDNEKGRILLPKTMDLVNFTQRLKIYSPLDDAVFTIKGTIKHNEPGTPAYDLKDQYITVVDQDKNIPESINVSKLYLMSRIDFELRRLAGSWQRETFEIRINAPGSDDHAIWLYYIILYILFKNKYFFEEVGLESQTFGTMDFSRDLAKMPNNIWGRTIRMTFLVQHTWYEDARVLDIGDISTHPESNVGD